MIKSVVQKSIVIREIQLSDKTMLCKLMSQLGYSISEEDIVNRINIYLARSLNKAWIAEYNKTIVGSIAVDIIELFHYRGRFARIVSLVVDEIYRGKGIGKILVAHAENYAKEINCTGIEVTTGWHRAKTGTHDFYKNLQYAELKLYLAKELQ